MKYKIGIIVFGIVIIVATASASINNSGTTQNFPTPEVIGILAAVAMTTPAFGYLLIKRKNPA